MCLFIQNMVGIGLLGARKLKINTIEVGVDVMQGFEPRGPEG